MVETKIENKYFSLCLTRNFKRLCAKGRILDSRVIKSDWTLASTTVSGRAWYLALHSTMMGFYRYGIYMPLCDPFCMDYQYATLDEARQAFKVFKDLALKAVENLDDALGSEKDCV